MVTEPEPDPAMARARARARQLRQLYQHLTTYGLVMALLVVIDLATGRGAEGGFAGLDWAYWPALGWGLFVAAHAASVGLRVGDWEDSKAKELYERDRKRSEGPSGS